MIAGLEPGEGRALRFRTPREGSTKVVDLIRGEPVFENALIEDFVLQRSNGTAMFILANVVDDIDMRISHVIRAEEHLPNTPKAILLWQALDGGDAARVRARPAPREREAPEALEAPRSGRARAATATRATCPRRCRTS